MGSGGVPVKDARSEALWTRLSIKSAVWRQLPAIAISEKILVSLQKGAVIHALCAVHFCYCKQTVCFQLQIQLCFDQQHYFIAQFLALETSASQQLHHTWINLKWLIQHFSDLDTPRTFAAHSFHKEVDQKLSPCHETADHIRGNELKEKTILFIFFSYGRLM